MGLRFMESRSRSEERRGTSDKGSGSGSGVGGRTAARGAGEYVRGVRGGGVYVRGCRVRYCGGSWNSGSESEESGSGDFSRSGTILKAGRVVRMAGVIMVGSEGGSFVIEIIEGRERFEGPECMEARDCREDCGGDRGGEATGAAIDPLVDMTMLNY